MIYRSTKTYADPQMQRLNLWVADMMGASVATAKLIGCSPEAVVAQAALESAWGRAAIGHNIFGIKADSSWQGPRLRRNTAEQRADGSVYFVDDDFRDYPTYEACIADHFAFLQRNHNYADAGVFDPDGTKSDREYFEALKRAGYATDVNYVDKLMGMLKSVQLFTTNMVARETADAVAQAKPAPRLLLVGMQGADVGVVQSALKAGGFYAGKIDDDFGPITRDAVIDCQRAKHLDPVDGIVGKDTRAALGL